MSFIKFIKKWYLEIIFIAPLIIFLLFFTLLPIWRTLVLSFQDAQTQEFSLLNFKELVLQQGFRGAFINTIFIALASLILEIALGLILALILSRKSRITPVLRTLFILPLAIPTVVVGVMMSYLFASSGWVNRILMDLSLLDSPISWMGGGINSLIMIVAADSWKVTPIVMLILLAGIQSIDRDLYRQARVDGAGSLEIFKRITLPLLMPYITCAVIIRGIDAFRIFALPLILMGQNLRVLGTYAYLEYTEYNNPYLSAASSVLLLAMILAALVIYIRTVGKKGISVA